MRDPLYSSLDQPPDIHLSRESRRLPAYSHGSSEGHEMLKRNDKYHSIADDVPIPKMHFFIKIGRWPFSKIALLCLTRYLFL